MIKTYTNLELFNLLQNSTSCLNTPGVVGFVLSHNYNNIYAILEDYIENRNKIVEKYGERTDDGFQITDSKKMEIASKELDDYDSLTHDIDIVMVPESRIANANLSATQFMAISWMVTKSSNDDIRAALGIVEEKPDEGEHYDVTKPPEF